MIRAVLALALALTAWSAGAGSASASAWPVPVDGTYVVPEFRFADGETMKNLRLHDQINLPELGIAERQISRVKRGRFVLLPITPATRGHGTHTLPAVWGTYVAQLLAESAHPR